jgi:hypothetical protein
MSHVRLPWSIAVGFAEIVTSSSASELGMVGVSPGVADRV